MMQGLRKFVNVISFTGFALIVVCHVTTGCGPPSGGGGPGTDGTYIKPPDEGTYEVDDIDLSKTDIRARRAIRGYRERPTPELMFNLLDNDKNGNIDACEWMEAGMTSNVREFVKNLDEVDSDEDNVLSVEEFKALKFRWKYGGLDEDASPEKED